MWRRDVKNCVLKTFELFLLGAQLDKMGFTILKKCISAVEARGNVVI